MPVPRAFKSLPEFLREARAKAGKTQKKVADELDLSVPFVSQWETGERRPPLKKLGAIAQAYQVEEEELKKYVHVPAETKCEAEDGYGVKFIERFLGGVADSAEEAGTRAIIHSYSTQGFLSGENPTLAKVVLECAAAGVDVVFVAFPPGSTRDEKPDGVRSKLERCFREAEEGIWSSGHEIDMTTAKEHLWFVTCSDDPLGVAGAVFGSVLRLLAVIHETKHAGDTEEAAGGVSAEKPKGAKRGGSSRQAGAEDRDDRTILNRVMPDRFTLYSVWLNIDKTAETGDTLQKWERGSHATALETRYRHALKRLKESGGFTIRRLLT